jgi:hypothetical protein
MNEGYLEHAGVKGMKWGVRKSKVSLNSSTKRKDVRRFSEREKTRLMIGGLGSLVASPAFGGAIYGATKYANRKNTKQAVADILGSDISTYSKSSLRRARKTLNKYGNVEIETKKGTVSLNYEGAGTRPIQTGKSLKPTAAAQRQVAKIPKEFKPRIMPDGRSIEITGTETGNKEVWKTY